MKHIRKAVIQQDDLTGDLFVTIPEEILKDLTWEEGDVVRAAEIINLQNEAS